jgi:hypothetical protein
VNESRAFILSLEKQTDLDTLPSTASVSRAPEGQLMVRSFGRAESGVLDSAGESALDPLAVTASRQSGESDFRLRHFVGRGAQGEVWSAFQESLQREVAVKVHLSGDPADFLIEARTAAELDHPNIVPAHQLGSINGPSGPKPLLAMKLVRGKRWDKLMAFERQRSGFVLEEFLARHLAILLSVCDAVSYAHSKGIVHRDLKPQQVVAGDYGEVFLLDWGMAISLAETLPSAGATASPRFRRRQDAPNPAGTPAYMAPEQTEPTAEGIGFHTDVYLLGAMLFHIVAGHPPHASEFLVGALLNAAENNIRPLPKECPEELARLLRKALSTEPEARHASAEQFQTAVREFVQGVSRRRESEEIADKANLDLEALPSKGFYEGFARAERDLERALTLWPGNKAAANARERLLERRALRALEAGDFLFARSSAEILPDDETRRSLLELVDKAASASRRLVRQRRQLLAAALILAAVAMIAGGLAWMGEAKARQQERLKNLFRGWNDLRRHEAALAAELEAALPSPLSPALSLDGGSHARQPFNPRDMERLLTLREKLRAERARLSASLPDASLLEPEPYALLLAEANAAFHQARNPEETSRAFELYTAAARARPDLPEPRAGMGAAALRAGRPSDAAKFLAKAVDLARAAYGENSSKFSDFLALQGAANQRLDDGAANYVARYADAAAILEPQWADLAEKLSLYWSEAGEYDRALRCAQAALEARQDYLGPQHPHTAAAHRRVGRAFYLLGLHEQSEVHLEKALAICLESLGPEHPETALCCEALGDRAIAGWKYRAAETAYRQALTIKRRHLGDDHPSVAALMLDVAFCLEKLDRLEEARSLGARALAILADKLGRSHPRTAEAQLAMANILWRLKRFDEALLSHREGLRALGESLGEEHPATLEAITDFAYSLRHLKRFKEGALLMRRNLERQRRALGDRHQTTLATVQYLALVLEAGAPSDPLPLILSTWLRRLYLARPETTFAQVRVELLWLDKRLLAALLDRMPPRPDLAKRVLLRAAALHGLTDAEAAQFVGDDIIFELAADNTKVHYLAERAAELGLEDAAARQIQRGREERAQIWPDLSQPIATARLLEFLDAAALAPDWEMEFLEIGDWTLDAAEYSAPEEREQAQALLERLMSEGLESVRVSDEKDAEESP